MVRGYLCAALRISPARVAAGGQLTTELTGPYPSPSTSASPHPPSPLRCRPAHHYSAPPHHNTHSHHPSPLTPSLAPPCRYKDKQAVFALGEVIRDKWQPSENSASVRTNKGKVSGFDHPAGAGTLTRRRCPLTRPYSSAPQPVHNRDTSPNPTRIQPPPSPPRLAGDPGEDLRDRRV